jgi:hypothetical protein
MVPSAEPRLGGVVLGRSGSPGQDIDEIGPRIAGVVGMVGHSAVYRAAADPDLHVGLVAVVNVAEAGRRIRCQLAARFRDLVGGEHLVLGRTG